MMQIKSMKRGKMNAAKKKRKMNKKSNHSLPNKSKTSLDLFLI